jgi:hypothetical protein
MEKLYDIFDVVVTPWIGLAFDSHSKKCNNTLHIMPYENWHVSVAPCRLDTYTIVLHKITDCSFLYYGLVETSLDLGFRTTETTLPRAEGKTLRKTLVAVNKYSIEENIRDVF